ncbi:SMP-30/gluconolactonase/LRE family protein [Alicyclobacillus tolerans]|uniref:SMP-30/gluconolactonase/LRE family protein n=1 Tax=Alicyclobacillus tolerans TaxID=90970 RepID=UPI001F1B368C|nr:SMP-30/gluconolactonase/LRE family protein [Alicyclobacillus tolerans]MCF8565609.1 SMP-30/gluconolactonase/LRE family protein [Alicyclobacillus tolerans]
MDTDLWVLAGPSAIVGECPTWDPASNRLYWVDIKGHQVHAFDPIRETTKTHDVGQFVGALAVRASGGLVLALHHGFYSMDLENGNLNLIAHVEEDPEIRFNDGKCDPAGRFWAGTMSITGKAHQGKLYCLDTDGSVRVALFITTARTVHDIEAPIMDPLEGRLFCLSEAGMGMPLYYFQC